jgi:hypothetical protein
MRSRSAPLLNVRLAALAFVVVLSTGAVRGQAPTLDTAGPWDTFVADVMIRHARVRSDGTPVDVAAPPLRYRWERTLSPSGWKTILSFHAAPGDAEGGADARPQDARYAVARLEDDGDGTRWRAFNRRGELMQLPPLDALGLASARQLLPETAESATGAARVGPGGETGREWIENLIASPARRHTRRETLTRRFGREVGMVSGLTRFLRTEQGETEELLADPVSGLPAEVNLVRGGRLVFHSRLAYSREAEGAWIRRATHVEQEVSDTGERIVTDLELSNVRLERRRQP